VQPYWLHAYLLVYVPVGLYADTKVTALWQQDVLGALTFVALYLAALKAPPGSRAQVWVCVAVATCFEVFASLVWGIYRYRMHNLPLFVPPGHGMVYLFGVLAAQTPIVRRLGRKLAYGVLAVACACVDAARECGNQRAEVKRAGRRGCEPSAVANRAGQSVLATAMRRSVARLRGVMRPDSETLRR